MVKIAILNLMDIPAEFGGGEQFGELIHDWLQPAMPDDNLRVVWVAGGAPVPQVADFDGFVIGGAEIGVYDDAPWMAPLRALLLAARTTETPLFGICFGHQIMADTFGGKAELMDGGDVVGARRFHIEGAESDAHVWHRDQVTKVPDCATVLGGADYCPVGVLGYDFPAYSVQFHPECTAEFLIRSVAASAGKVISAEVAETARISLEISGAPVDLMAARAAMVLGGTGPATG